MKQAQNRLDNLKTSRTSVTEIQAIPVNAVNSFGQITASLIDVNSSLVQSANDAELLLGLTTVANYERVKDARATEAAILTSVVVRGAFSNQAGQRCPVVTTDCISYTERPGREQRRRPGHRHLQ